jgi:hypothetical protein
MSISLKEDLFEKFLRILEHKFERIPRDYSFMMEKKTYDVPTFSHLESFLLTDDIPYRKVGVCLNKHALLPVTMFIEGNEALLPFGIYFVYPETDQEIIYYFYVEFGEEHRDAPHYILCYRKEDVFKNLIARYHEFCAAMKKEENVVVVYGGRDIPRPHISWDELILPHPLKEDIRLNIENFMLGELTYRKFGIPYKRGLLFTGPPGNGKTMLLKVIASSYPSWQMVIFRCRINSDNGDLDNVFEDAKNLSPAILCFEDVDSLFRSQISLSHFLNKLDGFENWDKILILATTNHPENIDPALTSRPSRFDRIWIINNPDHVCRRFYIRKHFHGHCSDGFMDNLAKETEGFSMAYLKELYVSASLKAINTGVGYPGEQEIAESFNVLASQLKGAQNSFLHNVRTLGFREQ